MADKHYLFRAKCPKCGKKCEFEAKCDEEDWYSPEEWVVFSCECGMQFVNSYDEVTKYNQNPKKRKPKLPPGFTQDKLF